MDKQAPAASALQLSTFTKVQSIPRPEKYPGFPVNVRLAVPGANQTVRAPVDIVAAIDVSMSSKTNDPMLDLEKAAMALVIEKLGPDDRLAVLPFSHKVEKDAAAQEMGKLVYMTMKGKKNIGRLVEARNFTAGGGTTLVKPINEAEKILMGNGDADRAAFILLLSDGKDVTVLGDKEWSRESELKHGVPEYPVHTFGFSNHNRDTLITIAERTQGKYFPEDIAGDGDLEKFAAGFEARLSEATSRPFSAIGATTSLASVHPGVSISRIDSGEKKASISGDARSGDVDIGTINAGETPEFTMYLDVPEGDVDADVMEVLAVSGAYTQGWDGKHVNLGRSVVSVNRPVPTPPKREPKPEPKPEPEPNPKPEPRPQPEPEPKPVLPQDSCKELDKIQERLDYWCKVKKDLSTMDEKADLGAANKCQCHVTAVLRDSALEAINRAMYLDIYTVVVQVTQMRRCGDGGGQAAVEHTDDK